MTTTNPRACPSISLPAALASVALVGGAVALAGPNDKNASPADQAEDHAMAIKDLEPRTGLPVGFTAPDVELKTAKDEDITLGGLIEQAAGPVVLVFYRGGWCPYCTQHLSELAKRYDQIESLGASIIAVSPEAPDKVAKTIEDTGVGYTIISDASMQAAVQFNLAFELDEQTQSRYRQYGIALEDWNASGEWKLPVPGVFVIDQDRSIRWAHVDEDYRKRVPGDEILDAVREIVSADG